MKPISVLLLLGSILINDVIAQSDSLTSHPDWSFRFELINPHKKVDYASYFLITLENKMDTMVLIRTGIGAIPPNAHIESSSTRSYYRFEFLLNDGTTKTSRPIGIGPNERERENRFSRILEGKEQLQLKPFDRFVSFGFNEYSLFGSYSFYKKVIKVRVRLEKFTYCKVVPRRNYTEIQMLVTNWIDVTGNDFDAAMQNQLRKGFISR